MPRSASIITAIAVNPFETEASADTVVGWKGSRVESSAYPNPAR
jgi:hypothetical protein